MLQANVLIGSGLHWTIERRILMNLSLWHQVRNCLDQPNSLTNGKNLVSRTALSQQAHQFLQRFQLCSTAAKQPTGASVNSERLAAKQTEAKWKSLATQGPRSSTNAPRFHVSVLSFIKSNLHFTLADLPPSHHCEKTTADKRHNSPHHWLYQTNRE